MDGDDSTQVTVDDILSGAGGNSQKNESEPDELVFQNQEILKVDNIPDEERIHGRDEQIEWLAKNLRKMVSGGIPDNVIEWGETGTGKTLVSRYVCQRLEQISLDVGKPIVATYFNSDPKSTFTSTFRSLSEQVNEKADDPVKVPYSGISADHYRNKKLWPVVESEFPGGLVVIIDEMDKHPQINEVLYTLSRSQSKDGVDFPVVTIGISNDVGFKSDIDTRVQSTLQPEHRTFTPYDQSELVKILDNRRDAFKSGVVDDEIIEKVAEQAAIEHGDARRAVRLLRKSGEVAVDKLDEGTRSTPTIKAEDVEEADDLVDVEVFLDLLGNTSLEGKLVLFALTRLARNNPEQDWFRTSKITETYQLISRDVEVDPKSYNRVLDALNNHVTTGFLASRKTEGGEEGKHKSYSILSEPDVIRKGLLKSTPELRELMGV